MSPSTASGVGRAMGGRHALPGFGTLYVGQFLANQTALTFSALIPVLGREWRLTAGQAGVILGALQLGQLAAYLLVGFLLDRMRSKPIMLWSAALVGMGDLLFAGAAHDFASGVALRFLAGLLLGGLYLPALKYIADAVPGDRRGRAMGIFIAVLVGAYASPLLYVGILYPHIGWRATMAAVGVLELVGALVIALGLREGPAAAASGGVGVDRYLGDVLRNRPARRIILAYAAHNWELFGMWGWMTPFMVASLSAQGRTLTGALAGGGRLAAAMIGLGGSIGAVLGGRLSDRLGRARAATLMLAISLVCSLGFGWLLTAPAALIVSAGMLYGVAALADSPSYSAGLMEAVPARSLGGALSVQMLFGWSATAVAPAAFGAMLDFVRAAHPAPAVPWAAAFGILALGPLVGITALAPLRAGRWAGAGGGLGTPRGRAESA